MTKTYRVTDPLTLLSVGASYLQDAANLGLDLPPEAIIPDPDVDQVTEVGYPLPDFANNVANQGRRILWRPGQQLPSTKTRSKIGAVLTSEGRSTQVEYRAAVPVDSMDEGAFRDARFADAQAIIPNLVNEALGQVSSDLLTFLEDDANTGAPIPFSVNLEANPSTAKPMTEALEALEPLNVFGQFRGSFKKVCFLDQTTWRILGGCSQMSGWAPGQPAGTPVQMQPDMLRSIMLDRFGVEEVWLFNTVSNAAARGATPDLGFRSRGLFGFGLVAREKSVNLRGPKGEVLTRGVKPDGFLVYATSRKMAPVSWVDVALETEGFAVRWAGKYCNPRLDDSSATMAIKFDPTTIIAP